VSEELDLEAIKERVEARQRARYGGPEDEGLINEGFAAAKSAADVPALVAEVERLREENERLRDDIGRLTRERDEWEANEQEQFREVERLRKVLEWYSQEDNWVTHPVSYGGLDYSYESKASTDRGSQAREALT
jgi:hypothetical protein